MAAKLASSLAALGCEYPVVMAETEVINMHGAYGRQLIDKAQSEGRLVVIGRPSKWGNPYKLTASCTREEAIAKYREWLMRQPELLADIPKLRGRVLACWCKPLACHGDVLKELADA